MKYLILLPAILLAGCQSSTAPIKTRPWPSVSAELLQPCAELQLVNLSSEKLSDLIKTVGNNYIEYHACSNKVNSWIEWYQGQKIINGKLEK